MYKYFKDSEIIGLKKELVERLENARKTAQTSFRITSGLRTIGHNMEIGGKENSAHLTGEAVDIACTDSQRRMRIVKALLQAGFNRIEIAPYHIHCDISRTLPQHVLFLKND
jgi:uncharacterized protein YcbK (DUF882 family)